LVIPGRSTSVKFTTVRLKTFNKIGSALISLLCPHFFCVSISISSRALLRSKYFSPGLCANSIQSCVAVGVFVSYIIVGRRVTMFVPRGKKSLPQMFSSKLDLPQD